VWVEPGDDDEPPNNWLSVFGGSAWEFDEPTAQYYLHSFLREQPDLNWRNPEVEAAMHDTLRFWLDRGVDGFRIDVAHYIIKDPDLTSNPPAVGLPAGQNLGGDYAEQDHIHDKGHPDVHSTFRGIRRVVDEYDGNRFTIGEIHVFDWDRWADYYGNGDELHMPYNFSLLYAPWKAEAFQELVDEMEAVLPPGAWPNLVLGNHDEVRMGTRYGSDRLRVAAMMLLTLRGTVTLYYGDEIGMMEAQIAPEHRKDPWDRDGTTRDGCRTPMQWDATPQAGFTAAAFVPWLPLGADHETVNVAAQRSDPTSLLNLYRQLLVLRRRSPALHRGEYVPRDAPPDVYAFSRIADSEEMLVALNFAAAPHTIAVPSGSRLVLATQASTTTLANEHLELGGNSGAIVGVP
jgi:glycosidase